MMNKCIWIFKTLLEVVGPESDHHHQQWSDWWYKGHTSVKYVTKHFSKRCMKKQQQLERMRGRERKWPSRFISNRSKANTKLHLCITFVDRKWMESAPSFSLSLPLLSHRKEEFPNATRFLKATRCCSISSVPPLLILALLWILRPPANLLA